MIEIALRVVGVDLEDERTNQIILEKFPDTVWDVIDGLVTVTLFLESDEVVAEVVKFTRSLESEISGVKIIGVYRDLVGISDVAMRAGVSREGARKWSQTADFPTPFDYVGSGSMKVWTWTEIVGWLKSARGLDVGQDLASVQLMTQIENCLMRNPDHTSVQWQQAVAKTVPVQPVFLTVVPAVRVVAGGRAQGSVKTLYTPVGAAVRVC